MFSVGRWVIVRGFALLLAVVLLALLAAACDGGGDGDSTTPRSDGTAAEGETPAAGGGGSDGGGSDGGGSDGGGSGGGGSGGGGDGGLAELEALASQAAGVVTAKITYQFTSDAGGEVVKGEWVLVQRPPDSRFETSIVQDGEQFRTIIINTAAESYVCSSVGGVGTCLITGVDSGAQAAPFDPLFDVPGDLTAAEGVELIDRSERSIAGLDATCFTVRSDVSGFGEGEVCLSEDGLLLFLRSETDGGGVTFEATSVSTDVTDADFEPPFEVFDLGDLGDFDIPSP